MPTRFATRSHALDVREHVFTSLLLVSDLGWILLLPFVNPAMLIGVVVFVARVVATTDRTSRPHESTSWTATLLWCVGNSFWMANDFANDAPGGIPIGIGHPSPIILKCALYAAGTTLAAGLAYVTWYFIHLRYTPAFVAAAANDALSDGGESGQSPNSTNSFKGPAFLPNVLNVKSHAEYEGISTALWIAKDLCWWCAVEMFPNSVFLEAVTVLVASALIAHTVDAAVLTWHNGDLIGFVNQATLLFWVCSFAIWCFGEVFFEEYEDDMPGDFTFLTKPPSHPLNLRWWASWVLTAGTVFFFGFWAVYACLVSIDGSRDERDDAKEPPSPPVETDRLLPMAPIPEA